MKESALIFEISRSGRKAFSLPECDVPELPLEEMIPDECLRDKDARLPRSAKWMLFGIIHAFPVSTMVWIPVLSAGLMHHEV